jgi:hypothetical protein
MRYLARPFLVVTLTALLSIGGSAAVRAAPTNDDYADRQTLTYGETVVIDTSTATVESLDQEATDACPSPPGPPPSTSNTVWFEFTADASTPATAAVFIDDAFWAAGVAIVTGDPGAFAGVACGPTLAIFNPVAGTTYRILIFDYLGSGGGAATVRLGDVPPPPVIGLTVDPTGTFDPRTGTATISGTYECRDASFAGIDGRVMQSVGRFRIQGYFAIFGLQCDGQVHAWSADVTATDGEFAGGHAMTVTTGFACGIPFCRQDVVQQTVLLKGQ